jgi:hypothetical protein
MKIAIQCVSCMFILVISAKGQQIGSVDLAHPPALGKFAERQERRVHPNGCEKIGGGIADGAVIPKKNQPHEIMLEVTSVSNKQPVAGSVMQAEVRLQNTGQYPIEIPWSPDPNTVERNQNPYRHEWEEGGFQVLLDRNDLLKSIGQTLYGSKFWKGSLFTIQPGEWITAAIDFKLELEYRIREQVVRAGKKQLRVEWEQASHTETLDPAKCEQWSGYFTYRNFYQQQNPAITISITKDRSSVR